MLIIDITFLIESLVNGKLGSFSLNDDSLGKGCISLPLVWIRNSLKILIDVVFAQERVLTSVIITSELA